MIVKGLSRAHPTVIRLPRQFTHMIILEESAHLSKSCKKGDLPKSEYCLVLDITPAKLLQSLKTKQEIKLSNTDFLALIDYAGPFNVENLEFIEECTGYSMNFFMKIENPRERRCLYSRVYRSQSQKENEINLLVKSRAAFCTDTDLEISGIVFRDISKKKISICDSCVETFTRPDNLISVRVKHLKMIYALNFKY